MCKHYFKNILLTLLTGRQFKTNKNQIGIQTNDYFICDFKKNKQSLAQFNILPYVEQCVVLCHIYLTLPISISEKNNFKKTICVRREFSLIISKNVVKQWSMGRYYTRKCFFFFLWWYEITILLLKEIDLCLNCLSLSLSLHYSMQSWYLFYFGVGIFGSSDLEFHFGSFFQKLSPNYFKVVWI